MANERFLPDVQREAEMRLNADPYFNTITVINYRKGDITQELYACLAGLAPKNGLGGAAVVILQPIGNCANANVRFPPFKTKFTFLVLEYPLWSDAATTGTGNRAETICRRILDLFNQFHPVGVTTPFYADEPFMVPVRIPVPTGNEGEDLLPISYECRFNFNESRGRQLRQPDLPVISVTAGVSISLSCGTSDCDIYYTLDGSPPAPPSINAAATLWEGTPFTPLFSCFVRAGAWRQQSGTDWTASDINIAEWDAALAENTDAPIGDGHGEDIGV